MKIANLYLFVLCFSNSNVYLSSSLSIFRAEAIILLLFFVMYMAFMIFCAQAKNSTDSLQSSLMSSYNSTDSAIAECCKRDNNYNYVSNTNYSAIDERTPLAATLAADYKFKILHPQQKQQQLYYQQQPQLANEAVCNQKQVDRLTDSVSLNLGIAIRNSTCLVKPDIIDDDGNHYGFHHHDQLQAQQYQQLRHNNNNNNHELLEQHEENWVSSKWILVPMLPLTLSMKCLTPCKFKNTCWTIWTFLVSIALIGGLTYISVWMVHLFGQTVGIPETIAGMTILSWGTGIPELIASIVLIKKTAQADMAICNTIGSNVIDVSFCLSLPW